MAEYTAKVPGAQDGDLVAITLAHPLPLADNEYLGLDKDQRVEVGDTIRVRPDHAKSLIGAGYATGVDPENPEQVKAALNGEDLTNAQGVTPDAAEQPAVGATQAAAQAEQTEQATQAPAATTPQDAPAADTTSTETGGATGGKTRK